MEALLGALKFVHEAGLIHGDVKPANIILAEPNLRPVLLDFGTSRQAMQETATITTDVSAGFAPFEQYQSRTKLTPATDLYSLGATLYRVVTGERPPDATDRVGDADPLVPLEGSRFEKPFGAHLCRLIDLALLVWPNERPQSVVDWRAFLASGVLPASSVASASPSANRSGHVAKPAKPAKRPVLAFGSVAVALLLALSGGGWWWFGIEQPRRADLAVVESEADHHFSQGVVAYERGDLAEARRALVLTTEETSGLIDVLLSAPGDPDAMKYNPRRVTFIGGEHAKTPQSRGIVPVGNDFRLNDSWGEPFLVYLDTNQDDRIEVPNPRGSESAWFRDDHVVSARCRDFDRP